MSLGQNIQILRKETGLTQAELARKIDVSAITIQQYERGVREPNLETIEKIAKALGVEFIDVLAIGTIQAQSKSHTGNAAITEKENRLLSHFRNLNDNGQSVAVERVQELTQIPRYQLPGEDAQSVPTVPDDKDPAEKIKRPQRAL